MASIYTMDGNEVTVGDLQEEADSRETDVEIMRAIASLSRPGRSAQDILADPTREEALAIWERVTGNGLRPSTDYVWGAAGTRWAANLGLDNTDQIETLRDEAAAHGDLAQVEVCERALAGDRGAIAECQRVIARAAAKMDITVGDRVESGDGEDHDTGRVESIDGSVAYVAWDSGVKTRAAVNALRLI